VDVGESLLREMVTELEVVAAFACLQDLGVPIDHHAMRARQSRQGTVYAFQLEGRLREANFARRNLTENGR
jgi:hypothetical protein